MAFSSTLIKHSMLTNEKVSQYLVTADAASGSVSTNLGLVDSALLGPVSMATSAIKIKINTSAASAAANGTIMFSSCASGDAFYIYVCGR